MPVNKARPFFCVLLYLISLSSVAAIQVTPEKLTVGKTSEITLSHPHADLITHITLNPGGPYRQQSIPLKSNNLGQYLITQDKNVLSITEKNSAKELVRFSNKKRTTVSALAGYKTSEVLNDVARQGNILFVASNSGLTLLDNSTPAKPAWLGSHQKLGQVVRVIADNAGVYAINDEGIVYLLDVSNPAEPTALGAYRSDEPIIDITASSGLVFLRKQNSVDIINFNGNTPQISNEGLDFGQGVNLGGERRVFIKDSLAYVADWFSGIHIYDISQPQRPILLSSFHTPGSPKGIVIREGIAFIADDDHGLQVVDVSDPLNPKFISNLLTKGLAYTPKLVDNLLYLASHRGGFQIIDISDVNNPELVSEVDTPGKAWSIEIKGAFAYVADDDSGLLIFNVSNPAKPEIIGQFSPGTAAEEVIVRGDLAFVAFFDDGLYILDVSNPKQPKIISHTNLPGNSRGLDLLNDKLYVASWLAGIHILDISNPISPKVLGTYDTRGATWGLKVKKGFLYVMDWWGGFTVLDVSKPSSPITAGSYHDRGKINAISGKDNYVFVANDSNGLQVFDVKNPLNPTWTTGTSFLGQAQQIALANQTAFVAAGEGGLAILDISNPFNTRWVSSIKTPGKAQAVRIYNEIAYVIDSVVGIIAYDIKQPNSPQQFYRLSAPANDLLIVDDRLYVATNQGLAFYMTSNKEPDLIEKFAIDEGVQKIESANGKIVAAAKNRLLLLNKELKPIDEFSFNRPITAILVSEDRLFVSTKHAINMLLYTPKSKFTLAAHYPMLSHIQDMEFHNGVIYCSGEKNITALRPLSTIQFNQSVSDKISLSMPNSLGQGHYNLQITYENGSSETAHNLIHVVMPTFSKPKLTLEDFKKLMEEKKKSDLFGVPNK